MPQNVFRVKQGGTGASTPSITALNNITGLNATGTTGSASSNLVLSNTPTIISPNVNTSLTTSDSSFNLLNTPTTVNAFTGAGTINIGSTSSNITFGSNRANLNAGSLEMGRIDGVASTPSIDFHAGATSTDYDSRIICLSGNGTTKQGELQIDTLTTTIKSSNVSVGLNDGSGISARIKFRSGATSTDYDARFSCAGGNGTDGNGTLTTIAGALNFASPAIYFSGDSTFGASALSLSQTGGIGYTAAASGSVTQITSKTTAVTVNTVTGLITMSNASMSAGAALTFTVNNSTVLATDRIVLTTRGGFSSDYTAVPCSISNGSFKIRLTNIGTTQSEAVIVGFSVLRGAS